MSLLLLLHDDEKRVHSDDRQDENRGQEEMKTAGSGVASESTQLHKQSAPCSRTRERRECELGTLCGQ